MYTHTYIYIYITNIYIYMPFISLIVNPKLLQVNRSLNLMNQLLTGFDDFSPFSDWMMTVCRLIFQNGNLQNPNFVWGYITVYP